MRLPSIPLETVKRMLPATVMESKMTKVTTKDTTSWG